MDYQDACKKLSQEFLEGKIKTCKDLEIKKGEIASAFNLDRTPRNSDILEHIPDRKEEFINILIKRPIRTMSGVAVIAVMPLPSKCPHGRCIYCPGDAVNTPQSYTGKEPATMRAINFKFHPFLQTFHRLKQLYNTGHEIDKVELIIMGGTFPSQSTDYQEYFIRECLNAMNFFDPKADEKSLDNLYDINFIEANLENRFFLKNNPHDFASNVIIREPLTLYAAQKVNEKSKIRCIGMTFETRPDWAKEIHCDRMLSYGGTRVELGVQTISDEIYQKVNRGHTVSDVIEATRILKDAGFKINYHMMPGLPGSSIEKDIENFRTIFSNKHFMPDMVKFYSCLVLEGTELYEMWKKGEYTPYTTEEALELILKIKEFMPKWVRTMRIQRDIPSTLVLSGVKRSNLGQMVEEELKKRNIRCKCVRCREVGRKAHKEGIYPQLEDIQLLSQRYEASEGLEYFISFEDVKRDILIGYVRLRKPSEFAHRKEISKSSTGIIRELHVYGGLIRIGDKKDTGWQHQGYGRKLLKEAERIAKEELDLTKLVIISGIGAREYYRKFKYKKEGPYMSKNL
ncbi:MAG: coproporphyrinogen III oxidase [Candidatus Methanofastidiosum methylothiophilum]|uniref:tRNA carboxymethyluridine synthase n=1 Tax=Candidatus Methanofastidiosum methylothiophilum TaxID=1705564 RepID=A0A150IYY0_9EURY|nr:MAG: coproporphyrinogen III oxidase [Candidatus Methanofastidiosum methylthiophilus]